MAGKLSPKQIRNLQFLLNAAKITDGDGKPLKIDGSFGKKTRAAVEKALSSITPSSGRAQIRALQASLNAMGVTDAEGKALAVDGIVGKRTRAALAQMAPQEAPMSRPGLEQMVNPSRPQNMSRRPPVSIQGETAAGRDATPNASGALLSDSLQWDSRIHGQDPFMASAQAGQDQQPTASGEFTRDSLIYDSMMHGADPFQASASGSVGQGASGEATTNYPFSLAGAFGDSAAVEAHPLDRLRIAAQGNPRIGGALAQAAMARARQIAAERDRDAWWKRPEGVGAGFVSPFGDRSPELPAGKTLPPEMLEGILARLSAR